MSFQKLVPGGPRHLASFPLYAKILLCLSLNVVLAAGVLAWLLRAHFGVGQDWLLNEGARGRLQAMSQVLTTELREAPPGLWDGILERTGEAQRVRMALFDTTGGQVAGPKMDLPSAVAERLQSGLAPSSPGGRLLVIREGAEGAERPLARARFLWPHERMGDPGTERDFPKEAFRTDDPDGYWFLVRLPHLRHPPLVVIGMTERLGETGLLFDPKPWLWAAAGVFGCSVLLWLPLARSVTRSISEMTVATEEIARGRFDTRVDEQRRDELGRLGGAINRMSGRLEGFVAGRKRFLGDVAHELCSPLARMEIGLGVLEQRIQETERVPLDDVREELREMRELVSELLAFSKAELESARAAPEPVALGPLVRAVVEREAAGAPIEINVPDNSTAMAAPVLLQRALANLLRNAVQHAGEPPRIVITASTEGDRVTVRVCDHGPGVSPEALPLLFDPFYRADASRSRQTGGAGLGLAIVKSCVQSCAGEVTAHNREGGGLVVELCLPAGKGSAPAQTNSRNYHPM
jgi:two-component system, OmpR family, sensor histidine kinase CpxA